MSCDTLRMRGVLLVAASGALLASCETVHIPPEGPTVVAAVAGTPDQLAAFEPIGSLRAGTSSGHE